MASKPAIKSNLHSRNKNREAYDLEALKKLKPELTDYIKPNKYGNESIDFSDPKAVRILNQALLHHYYGIENWDFPEENLTPPIPGRADYLHYMADLLRENNYGAIPEGDIITCLDVGVGASCIYPLLGTTEYGWKFIGSDIDSQSVDIAKSIVYTNANLKNKISIRLQEDPKDFFYGVIDRDEMFDISICNPPFHNSKEDAAASSRRKVQNLTGLPTDKAELNFSGIQNELVYPGGEMGFITAMIKQSFKFSKNCFWFTTLVSKKTNLKMIYKSLQNNRAVEIKTIPMGTSNKTTRIIAWTFLSKEERQEWRNDRWHAKKSKS